MKVLAVNGSPRKKKNTAQLLEQFIAGAKTKGAEAELVHLSDYRYTGCLSCFACKRIGGPSFGRCALKDDLRPILDKAHDADILVLGSPVYFGTETALMRSFEERLWFQYLLYSKVKPTLYPRKKATALFFTMNVTEEQHVMAGYQTMIDRNKALMERMSAPCEVMLSCSTLQFDDYSQYDTDMFDAEAKRERHATIFPQELLAAFALGARLVS